MATLDIRSIGEEITHIQFGDYENGTAGVIRQSTNEKEIFLQNDCEHVRGYVRLSDIDNLILALQKAKEMWGK